MRPIYLNGWVVFLLSFAQGCGDPLATAGYRGEALFSVSGQSSPHLSMMIRNSFVRTKSGRARNDATTFSLKLKPKNRSLTPIMTLLTNRLMPALTHVRVIARHVLDRRLRVWALTRRFMEE